MGEHWPPEASGIFEVRPDGDNKKRHGAEAPVAFDSEVETTEPGQAHSANCFRGQRPLRLSYVRLLLQDGASLPLRGAGVKPISVSFLSQPFVDLPGLML